MSAPLPKLVNARGIMAETGLSRAGAEALMRQLPKTRIPGHRAAYVRRADVVALLDENTVDAVARRLRVA